MHPPCGLYRTTRPLNAVGAGRLVSFHNHGEPGPGIYLPQGWQHNRVQWHERGDTVPDSEWSSSLVPVPAEGLYSVTAPFYCCEKRCTHFETGQLVQLGYDGDANPILFVPEWTAQGLTCPERGSSLSLDRLGSLRILKVAQGRDAPKHSLMH